MNNMSIEEAKELCDATESLYYVKKEAVPENLIKQALDSWPSSQELAGIYLFNLGRIAANIKHAKESANYDVPIDIIQSELKGVLDTAPSEEFADAVFRLMVRLEELAFRQGYYAALKYEVE